MRCVSVTLLLCLALMLLGQYSCQINGRSACPCIKKSNRDPRKQAIESYMIQKAGVCHIDAVLFKTVSGHFVCSDPQKPWVKEAIEFVNNKKKPATTTASPINSTTTSTLNSTTQSC